ncbi:MAG: GTPase, partial [Phormidesmis sp.]
FMSERVALPMVVGLTHTDCEEAWSADNVAIAMDLAEPTQRPPFVEVNATEPDSVTRALSALIQQYILITGAA